MLPLVSILAFMLLSSYKFPRFHGCLTTWWFYSDFFYFFRFTTGSPLELCPESWFAWSPAVLLILLGLLGFDMVALNLRLHLSPLLISLNFLLHCNLLPLSSQYFIDMEVASRQKKTRHSLPLTLFPLPSQRLHSPLEHTLWQSLLWEFAFALCFVQNSVLPFQDHKPHLFLLSAVLFFNITYHNLTSVHVYCIAFSTRM